MSERRLLAIIELGGYPDFTPLYRRLGFSVEVCASMRKALAAIRRQPPDVIVCEFNYQSDFRDRTSSLESMIGAIQKHPGIRTVAMMEPAHRTHFKRLASRYGFHAALDLPVSERQMEQVLLAEANANLLCMNS